MESKDRGSGRSIRKSEPACNTKGTGSFTVSRCAFAKFTLSTRPMPHLNLGAKWSL